MTIQITITCEDNAEALLYLNAVSYHSLISDFQNQIRLAKKHDGDVLKVVDNFMTDFYNATEHHIGPY
jgi:hypothetical protein